MDISRTQTCIFEYAYHQIITTVWRLLVWRYLVLTTNCALDHLFIDIYADVSHYMNRVESVQLSVKYLKQNTLKLFLSYLSLS